MIHLNTSTRRENGYKGYPRLTNLPKGEYTQTFEGGALAVGIYFLQLQTDQRVVEVRRLKA